ncbi:MAG: hypothetical protein ACRDJC_04345, partial [Thermomicrobiales bacterium]
MAFPSHTARAIADIAVSGARSGSDGLLSYAVPPSLRDTLAVGQVVWVPLRGKPALAVVVRLHDEAPPFALKAILTTADPPARISAEQLATARWLARQSASSLYDALALFLPPGAAHRARPFLRLAAPAPDLSPFTAAQKRLLTLLEQRGETSLEAARSALGTSLASVVPALEEAGAIEVVYHVGGRLPTPRQERWVRLLQTPDPGALANAPNQAEIIVALRRRARLTTGGDGFVPSADILAQSGANRASLTALVRKGIVEEIERPTGMATLGSGRPDTVPELTATQSVAWNAIEEALRDRDATPFLLY